MYLGKMGTSSHFLSAFTIFVKFFATQKSHGHYHFRHRILLRRHFGRSHPRPDAPLERNRLAGRAPKYGGVIPELASRAHQQNIVPVVDTALKEAGVTIDKIDAIAFTRGPGLLGSLLVGVSFAKGLSISTTFRWWRSIICRGILSHFLDLPDRQLPHPDFPFLCLLVIGGHTQIVKWTVRSTCRSSARRSTTRRAKRSTSAPKSWGCPIRAGR